MEDDLRQHIQKLREDFSRGSLSESEVLADPARQFRAWMQDAVDAQIIELQAMTLSTVSAGGRPSSRVVYLREFGENAFTFYTNYESRKGQELAINPYACLNFFWPHLERQIRIEGTVKKTAEEGSDRYFLNRPYESQLGAWASKQSGTLKNREELEKKIEELRKSLTADKITRPPFWGGYTLQAEYYEFWQGRKSRLHDRIVYKKNKEGWNIERLSP